MSLKEEFGNVWSRDKLYSPLTVVLRYKTNLVWSFVLLWGTFSDNGSQNASAKSILQYL